MSDYIKSKNVKYATIKDQESVADGLPAVDPAGGSTLSRPLRVLFACPQTVFDVSNGASLLCYSMVQELARRGLRVGTFGGAIFDNPAGMARIPNLKEQIEANKEKKILVNNDFSAGEDHPVTHWFFTGFHSTKWDDMTQRASSTSTRRSCAPSGPTS